jgi:hypothetical protein
MPSYTTTLRPSRVSAYDDRHYDVSQLYYLPDSDTKERVREYAEAELLLDVAEHIKLFQVKARDQKASYIPLDFAGMLARLMRHYTFSPGFTVRAVSTAKADGNPERVAKAAKKADANITRIMDNSDAVTLFREVAESLPVLGDAVIRVDLVEASQVGVDSDKPQAYMRYVKPHQAHVTASPLDNRKVEEITLAWMFPAHLWDREDDRFIVLREIHVPGFFQFVVNWWDGENFMTGPPLGELFPGLEEGPHETGIDEIPLVFIHNNRKAGDFWGRSEFPRIKAIIQALENRLAQLDEVLEKHARPKLIVGPGVLDEKGQVLHEHFDVIEVESSILEKAVKPEYLTWDMKIEGIKHEIEKLEEYFFMFTETSPASFGLERDGSQVESARALRFKAHRTINKVEDLRDPFGDGVKRLMRIAQKLETSKGGHSYKLAQVQLEWPDPIIEDDTQEATDYSMLRQNQLVSLHRAVKDLFDLSDEEARVEVARILQDEMDLAEAQGAGAIPGLVPIPAGGEAAPAAGLAEVVAPGAEV